MPSVFLILGFLLAAALYAAIGFGGGSTYNALLVLAHTDYRSIPLVALTCNLIVVTGGVYHFSRSGHFSWKALAPFASASIPMAWLGGRMPVGETVFVGLLGLALLLTSLHLFVQRLNQPETGLERRPNRWLLGIPAGSVIGLVSGIVGVGGGIFLAPILYLFNYARPREIAAMASGFILVNSVAGLAGQFMKHSLQDAFGSWLEYWPLYLAVLAGGQVGSRWGALRLPEGQIRFLTGALILYVSIRLLFRWAGLAFA